MNIGIRVDVNPVIATGHIKRDIAIALCLRQVGQECIFLSADEYCLPYLKPYGFESIILNSNWQEMEGELPQLTEVIRSRRIASLLVDSYQITPGYMKELIPLTYVTYFDEMGLFGYGCQQLINGVLEPPDYSAAAARALSGPKYVALRREFVDLSPKQIRPQIRTLLVTSGGTDPYHFCAAFLEKFLMHPNWQQVKVTVAVGELSVDREYLTEKYQENDRVTILVNCNHMAQLMQQADYAVTAGGTTLYEICATGVCASSYAIADNQLEVTKSFHRLGLVSYAGDFRAEPEETIERILEQMQAVTAAEERLKRSIRLQQIVDGKGALRIAQALIDGPGKEEAVQTE